MFDKGFSKKRLDINIPLNHGTAGSEYLDKLSEGLSKLESKYKIAFVVAGTDVVQSDPLGGLNLSVEECTERDALVLESLNKLSIPTVFLGGGGYSKDSAIAISKSIKKLHLTF